MDRKDPLKPKLTASMKKQHNRRHHYTPRGDDRRPFIRRGDSENARVRQVRFKTNETPVTKEKDTARRSILLDSGAPKGILKGTGLTVRNGCHQSRPSQVGNYAAVEPKPSTSGSRNFPSGQGSNQRERITPAANVKWGDEIVPQSEYEKLQELLRETTTRLSANFKARAQYKRMPLQKLIYHVSTLNKHLKEGGKNDCFNPLMRYMMALEHHHYKAFMDRNFEHRAAQEEEKRIRMTERAAEPLQETSVNLEVPNNPENDANAPVNNAFEDVEMASANMDSKPFHSKDESSGCDSMKVYQQVESAMREIHEGPQSYDRSRHSPGGIQNIGESNFANRITNCFPSSEEDGLYD